MAGPPVSYFVAFFSAFSPNTGKDGMEIPLADVNHLAIGAQ